MTSGTGRGPSARLPPWAGSGAGTIPAIRIRAHSLFLTLLAVGVLLRAAALAADRPALMLFGDSYSYLANAAHLHPEGWHPFGYAVVLRALGWTHTLLAVTLAQHLAAVLLSVALYRVSLRLGVRPWLAALGCAPLLLDAYQVFVEQTVVAETLFEVLLTGALLLLVTRRNGSAVEVAVVGLVLAAATLTRTLGLGAAALPALGYIALRRWGWLRAATLVVTMAVPVALYGYWFEQAHGQFAIDSQSGRLFYGRVEPLASRHCRQLDPTLPAAERPLCDPLLGADPRQPDSPNGGVNYYAWARRSPFYRLRAPGSTTRDQLAADYARRVALAEPGAYLWSTVVNAARFFAPTRAGVNPQAPIAEWQFLRRTEPRRLHVLLGSGGFYQSGGPWSPSTAAHWPIGWLADYQTVGYTPGVLLLVALLLVPTAFLLPARGGRGGTARCAAAALAGAGLLLLLIPAALTGDEPRYLLPALPLIPPAGALAAESLLARLRPSPFADPARAATQPG